LLILKKIKPKMHRNHFLNHKIVCDDEDNIPWAERVRQPVDQEDLKKKTKVVEVKKEETPDFEERSNKRKKAGVEETSSSGKKKKAGVEETSSNGKPVEQEDLKNEQEDPKKKKTKVEVKKEKTPDLEEKSKKRKKEAGVEETSSSGKKKKARVEETSSPSKKKKGEEDEEVWKWYIPYI
jgi:hypothetical protein